MTNRVIKILSYPILILLLVLTIIELYPIVVFGVKHLSKYQWMIYGMAAYFIIRKFRFFSRNEEWMQITSHEVTHAIVGLMFFHKIHSLEAYEDHGVVFHSGRKFGDFFISLAPYCLPITTYAFLLMRILGASKMLYVFDILIGFSLAFHIVCFWKQTRMNQTDIISQGYIRAFLFIFASWFFNATIIFLSIRKGIIGAIQYIFLQYWNDLCNLWNINF